MKMNKIAVILAVGAASLSSAEQTNEAAYLAASSKSAGKGSSTQAMAAQSGMPLDESLVPTAYQKSARLETGNSWDFSFNIAFNEYYVAEEGLEIAVHSSTTNTITPTGEIVAFNFDYHPGFQLGFTLNTPYDQWLVGGEYFWLRAKNSVSADVPNDIDIFAANVLSGSFAEFLIHIDSSWKVGIDMGDLFLSRPFYAGTNWSVGPFFGLRGGSIRQYFHLNGDQRASPIGLMAVTKSNSWLIGPRAGFQTNWLFPMGFSFFGDASASLLYTRYTTISYKNSDSTTTGFISNNNQFSSFTPNVEAGLGVRWGSYFSCQKYYFDLSAAYNFSVFFSQNQGAEINSVFIADPAFSPGKLFLHGVSIATSFLF